MRSNVKTSILLSAITACVIGGTFGTVTGTVAWFAYSTRTYVSYSGTSISNTKEIDIGLMTTVDMSSHGFTSEIANGITYQWAGSGKNLTSDIISDYLTRDTHGYATNTLSPVTSGVFSENNGNPDTLQLKVSPVFGDTSQNRLSVNWQYVVLPLCFRVKALGSVNEYKRNAEVWVTDAVAQADATSTGNVGDAIRVHFNTYKTGQNVCPFILKPNAASAGSTAVAGPLNLNNDDYYDYNYNTNEEYIYGDYTGTPVGSLNASDTDIVDENGTGSTTEVTTFTAKHRSGVTSFSGYTPKAQEFLSLNDIIPTDNVGTLAGGRPVCYTSDDEYAIGVCTLTIWLEGWDHTVVDAEIGHMFNLGLTFQVNK